MPKPADPLSDTMYDMPTLNRLFFASSILLIAVTVWMTWQDYDRNWKHFQRDFNALALKKAEKDQLDLTAKLSKEKGFELDLFQFGLNEARDRYKGQEDVAALEQRVKDGIRKEWDAANLLLESSKREPAFAEYWQMIETGQQEAEKQVEAKKSVIEGINEEREKNRGPLEKATQKFQFDKSEADTFKFKAEKGSVDYEHAKKHAKELTGKDGAAHAEAVLPGLEKDLKAAELRFEEKNKETIEAKKEMEKLFTIDKGFADQIAAILKATVELKKQIAKLETDLEAKKRQIAKLEPTWHKLVLNAPLMDAVAPSEKIDQNILPHFLEDVNFGASVFKIDRCTTCHLAIDRSKGWTK